MFKTILARFKRPTKPPTVVELTEHEKYNAEPIFTTLGKDVEEHFVCFVEYNDLSTALQPKDVYSISEDMIIYPLSEDSIYFTFKISEDHWSAPVAIQAKNVNISLIKTLHSIKSPQLD